MEAILNFDLSIFEFFQTTLRNGVLDVILKVITTLGDDGIFFIILGLVMLCFKKTRKAGLVALGALLVMTILNNEIIKPIMERPRPYNLTRLADATADVLAYTNGEKSLDWVGFFGKIDWSIDRFPGLAEKWNAGYAFPEIVERMKPTSLSFPSGHTSSAFTFAMAITLVLKNKGAAIASFIFAFLMGISRIYVGVHYPTDVIVGAVVGILYAVIGYFIFAKLYDVVYPKIENAIANRKAKKKA
ncbi:MAG: phosphatase PAP2 family protein [Clostridia bacterium]|nr:phosphatase PAP2 family protein [Clostridia bacterium]